VRRIADAQTDLPEPPVTPIGERFLDADTRRRTNLAGAHRLRSRRREIADAADGHGHSPWAAPDAGDGWANEGRLTGDGAIDVERFGGDRRAVGADELGRAQRLAIVDGDLDQRHLVAGQEASDRRERALPALGTRRHVAAGAQHGEQQSPSGEFSHGQHSSYWT
jgi:hypothetical protein